MTDRQAIHKVLAQRQNRYLARQLCCNGDCSKGITVEMQRKTTGSCVRNPTEQGSRKFVV